MKTTFKTISTYIIILSLFGLSNCSEDFLDREPSGSLTGESIKEYSPLNPEIAKGLLRGLYTLTFKHGTGGNGGHDDFGQKSIDIATDMLSGDMVLTGKTYGWFSPDYELSSTLKTAGRAYGIWRYHFQIIKAANSIIDGLKETPAEELSPDNKASLGQALALRAYSYYNLVNLYQQPYTDNSSALAVPIYTSQLTMEAQPLSTVEDVYNLIISDLETSVEMLEGFERTNKSEINKSVAQGLLAYAYLARGDYAKAAELSIELITSSEFRLMNNDEVIQSGFNSVDIDGWMWGIDLTKDNSPGLPTFWGMMDVFTYSYAGAGDGKAIDIDLYNSIPDNDIRKSQFLFDENDYYHLHPTNKFFDSNRVIFGDKMWENDLLYMRIAEMYLICAEANAYINPDESKKVLRNLLAQREPGASLRINALSDTDLLNEIHFQWRIECWGEGKSLFALKRFKGTVTRGANHKYMANSTYQYDDPRLIFQIPENELNNNPQIDINEIYPEEAGSVSIINTLTQGF